MASTGNAGASTIVTTSSTNIRRTGPPQAVQKVRENYFLVQLLLSSSPSADWRRLFYEAKHDAAEFQPRSVEISGALMRFRSEPANVEPRLSLIDRWIVFANEKEAGMANRSEDQRRKNQELAREAEELGQWNSRWAKL